MQYEEQAGSQSTAPPVYIGGISQLNARKPLSSFFTYNLLVYTDGLLFVQESFGKVFKTASVNASARVATGVGGAYFARRNNRRVFDQYMSTLSFADRNELIANPKNHWYPKGQIVSAAIKKGWFTDKITISLADGTLLKLSSKRNYSQRANILQHLPQAIPQTTVL